MYPSCECLWSSVVVGKRNYTSEIIEEGWGMGRNELKRIIHVPATAAVVVIRLLGRLQALPLPYSMNP